jgi:hypothetical protein
MHVGDEVAFDEEYASRSAAPRLGSAALDHLVMPETAVNSLRRTG